MHRLQDGCDACDQEYATVPIALRVLQLVPVIPRHMREEALQGIDGRAEAADCDPNQAR